MLIHKPGLLLLEPGAHVLERALGTVGVQAAEAGRFGGEDGRVTPDLLRATGMLVFPRAAHHPFVFIGIETFTQTTRLAE